MDPKLTLEDAKRKARQREAVSGQQDIVQDTGAMLKNARVEPVAKTKMRRAHYSPRSGGGNKDNKTTPRQSSGAEKCTRCGRGKHSRQECPAREAVCHSCKKRGHYSSQCFKRTQQRPSEVNIVEIEDEDAMYLDTIGTVDSEGDSWLCRISVNNRQEFMLKLILEQK